MNLLLDTHAVIWFITDDLKLPPSTKEKIKDGNNVCYVSLASYWEISIKHSLGRLDLNNSLERIFEIIGETDLAILQITPDHFLQTSKLAHFHRDPFDRLIIGQAQHEGLSIISKDRQFANYEVGLIWG